MNKMKIVLFLIAFISVAKARTCDYGFIWDSEKCIPCGLSPKEPNVKIVGGIPSIPNSWPSQVFLVQRVRGTYTYFDEANETRIEDFRNSYQCGGTLINPQTILTAAHCVIDTAGEQYGEPVYINFSVSLAASFTVYLGTHDTTFIYYGKPADTVVIADVAQVIKHPDYNKNKNLENDIALLILTEPVSVTPAVQPACLPKEMSTTYPVPGLTSFAAGWGTLHEWAWFTPEELYNVNLAVYESSKCDNSVIEYEKDYEKQICAGDTDGRKDTCRGDSGGSLIIREDLNGTVKNIASGIVSYGEGCARKDHAGIYTRVSYYLDWIYANWKVPSTLATTTTTTTTATRKTTTVRRNSTTTAKFIPK